PGPSALVLRDPKHGETFGGLCDQDVAWNQTAGATAVAAQLKIACCSLGPLDGAEPHLALALAIGGAGEAHGVGSSELRRTGPPHPARSMALRNADWKDRATRTSWRFAARASSCGRIVMQGFPATTSRQIENTRPPFRRSAYCFGAWGPERTGAQMAMGWRGLRSGRGTATDEHGRTETNTSARGAHAA